MKIRYWITETSTRYSSATLHKDKSRMIRGLGFKKNKKSCNDSELAIILKQECPYAREPQAKVSINMWFGEYSVFELD